MITFRVRNAQQALPTVLAALFEEGRPRNSRNGPVLVFDGPVCIEYERPLERVIFHPRRDANPFLHFFEALWMLAGRNDLAFVSQFLKNMKNYSDDGRTLHGGYGPRWRSHWEGRDQISIAIQMLRENPDSRRVVVAMWDPRCDLYRVSKDLPCNTHIYFSVRDPAPEGELDMTVCNRSNDLVWGALGANVVHMSMLQEYVAACLRRPVGRYWQFANNLHGYLSTAEPLRSSVGPMRTEDGETPNDPYIGALSPRGMFDPDTEKRTWDRDLALFMEAGVESYGYEDTFFSRVAKPLLAGHLAYRKKDWGAAQQAIAQCAAADWRRAAREWVERRRLANASKPPARGRGRGSGAGTTPPQLPARPPTRYRRRAARRAREKEQ